MDAIARHHKAKLDRVSGYMRFHHVPAGTRNKQLQEVLNPGAVALSAKAGCILSSNISGAIESIASAKQASRRNRGRTLVLCAAHVTDVRGLLIPELARAMGQPECEVDSAHGGDSAKCALLGRSLACGQIRHALTTLIRAVGGDPQSA